MSVESMEAVTFVRGERARPDWLRTNPRAWIAAVAAVCIGAFIGQLDSSIVALTYHQVSSDLHAPLNQVQWISLSYLIALAVLLVPVGAISDRIGRKRMYLWGFAVFGLSSLACALAPNLGSLDAMRAVHGVGAAMLQANSVALVITSVPREKMRTALGIQAAGQAIGLAIGPTVGGLIVQAASWRWVLVVNVPLALLGLIVGRYLLPRTRIPANTTPSSLGQGVLTALRVPSMPPRLIAALLGYLLLFGPIVLVPLVLQDHGVSAAKAGLVVAALAVGFALAASAADRVLPAAWSAARRCLLGLVLTAAGLGWMLAVGAHAGALVPGLLVTGLGIGVFAPANNALIMGSVPSHTSGLAGGMVNMARALGTAGGTAVITTSLALWTGLRPAVIVLLVLAAVAASTLLAGLSAAGLSAAGLSAAGLSGPDSAWRRSRQR
jgi:MFS family permease